MGEFTLREHTADVAVEATGDDVGATFAAVADGLAAAMCDDWPAPDAADGGERADLRVVAENPEAALYDYLDELIYERDVRAVLPVDNEARVEGNGEWSVDASYRGVPLSAVVAREVKAVTYSEMDLRRVDGGWEAYVVFDV
ncbi:MULTISPECIES: archease [Halolamina]|uniref:SHS2 domain-containing protein n=1 Tax=Halolamina pelagica TaxID=699431 RepID=A0A1I5V6U8_9EURY|nr:MULTISPECIES: archease [Halolamina]NHX37909.1 archease [Halolamina sp. R1-12]SFQ03218.1 SHS2 domain-containing protein [Halolamina pelagica]